MNEIFVEEENTVYELDAECLKRKEEKNKRKTVIKHRKQHAANKTGPIYGCYVYCL